MSDHVNSSDKSTDVVALLLTTPGCVHCAALKKILQKLLQEQLISRLDIIDVAQRPEVAASYGVKSVPWLQLENLQLQGRFSEQELRDWIVQINRKQADTAYLKYLLQNGELEQVLRRIEKQPELMFELLPLIVEPELDMKVRLGISAVFEEFQGRELLKNLVAPLAKLAKHQSAQIRADVAHYLALTANVEAIPCLEKLSHDPDREVRDIALESLDEFSRQ